MDAHDRAAKPLLVGPDLLRQISQRWLVTELAAECFARGFKLASDTTHASRPRVAPKRVDHGAADAPLGKCFELDAPALIEPMGGIDESDDAVLHQVSHIDRVGH